MKLRSLIPEMFRTLTPLESAARELVSAEHARLEAQTALEFAASMVSYNEKRITRLRGYIGTVTTTRGEQDERK